MEPDDLLCARNARPQKALVRRAQWRPSSPPSKEKIEVRARPMRAVKDSPRCSHTNVEAKTMRSIYLDLEVINDRFATPKAKC